MVVGTKYSITGDRIVFFQFLWPVAGSSANPYKFGACTFTDLMGNNPQSYLVLLSMMEGANIDVLCGALADLVEYKQGREPVYRLRK